MTLTITALASGSNGNALLARHGDAAVLIDCGVALRTLEALLRCQGLSASQINAVLLTHEHGDHSLGVAALARRHGVPVVCNRATREALGPALQGLAVEELPVGELAAIGPFEVRSFPVAHDAAEPVGLRLSAGGATVAVAVDLGSWDDATVAALRGADLLVVEANHDRELLRAAPYPLAIQQRICGARGHLDNVQCGALLARACAGAVCDVWLAHLSAQTNSPQVALAGVRRVLDLAGVTGARLRALPRRAAPGAGGAPTWSAEERTLVQRSLF
ncbi:MAG: MBL fold metallo-hydrolase [Chloroflexaceae bacterium]|nr:MBL fold metallo-hydrolase [Chloroflexaceae bacterium]